MGVGVERNCGRKDISHCKRKKRNCLKKMKNEVWIVKWVVEMV